MSGKTIQQIAPSKNFNELLDYLQGPCYTIYSFIYNNKLKVHNKLLCTLFLKLNNTWYNIIPRPLQKCRQ